MGDRVEHRHALHTRALHRSHTVCITKVDEAEFQEEVLKVGYIPVNTLDQLSIPTGLQTIMTFRVIRLFLLTSGQHGVAHAS